MKFYTEAYCLECYKRYRSQFCKTTIKLHKIRYTKFSDFIPPNIYHLKELDQWINIPKTVPRSARVMTGTILF